MNGEGISLHNSGMQLGPGRGASRVRAAKLMLIESYWVVHLEDETGNSVKMITVGDGVYKVGM